MLECKDGESSLKCRCSQDMQIDFDLLTFIMKEVVSLYSNK